jgi:(1->4)-alpha-D-glucan 1-alpha-D-glucosylmutase
MPKLSKADGIKSIIDAILKSRRIPGATYRLQFNQQFTFQDAYKLVPYLNELGITDCYASPLFKTRSGSTHGYDIVDYGQLNPVLGSQAHFDALAQLLQDYKIGLILDFVPNHMGIGSENAWWMDVLLHGPTSPYAEYFDINWQPPNRALEDKVLLPVLEDHYGRMLENQMFQLRYDTDFILYINDSSFPIAVGTSLEIVQLCYEYLQFASETDEDICSELASIIYAISTLPSYHDRSPASIQIRRREQIIIRQRLANLYNTSIEMQRTMQKTLDVFNGIKNDVDSFDRLDRLISEQPYRLAYWQVAADEINYRRFFDINAMGAIRIELAEVFNATHELLFKLIQENKVTGLRIDHPDGLWDPTRYFLQLQESYAHSLASRYTTDEMLIGLVSGTLAAQFKQSQELKASWPMYVVVEKILSEIESLPDDWAVYGTTGYDFLITVNNIFVNRDHVHAFSELYSHFIGRQFEFRQLIYQSKKLIISFSLASEIKMISQQLAAILERNRRVRNFTLNSLLMVLTEIVASMSIYRTYITGPGEVSTRDRHYIERAVDEAKQRNPRIPEAIFDFVRDILLLDNLYEFHENERGNVIEFVIHFQQVTSPVMAKGVEDTAFYVYNRLVSLNEVGGNPEQFGIGLDDFHKHNIWHLQHWPYTMLSLSTHDTKRSADARARLNVLSEIPGEWEAAIWRWSEMNTAARTIIGAKSLPDKNDEYLFYQALLCIWQDNWQSTQDDLQTRVESYMKKAVHEAKVHTSWANSDATYNTAIENFVKGSFNNATFMEDINQFSQKITSVGRFNSLSQTLLEMTSPGVPDIYQGNELWDYGLVDPDNRRLVDFEERQTLLRSIQDSAHDPINLVADLLKNPQNGAIKLYLVWRTLNFRREHSELFKEGDYVPVDVIGEKAQHVCCFQRTYGTKNIIVVAPVLIHGLTKGILRNPMGQDVWQDTSLRVPGALKQYRNIFTEEILDSHAENQLTFIHLASILNYFPVAVLVST